MLDRNRTISNPMPDPAAVLETEDMKALRQLAITKFRERGRGYDEDCSMPVENINELHERGWLMTTVSREFGGKGSNLETEDPATYLQAQRTIAQGCAGTAHCYQVTNHTAWCLEKTGTPRQKEKFLAPMRKKPFLGAFVGSEPKRKHMYQLTDDRQARRRRLHRQRREELRHQRRDDGICNHLRRDRGRRGLQPQSSDADHRAGYARRLDGSYLVQAEWYARCAVTDHLSQGCVRARRERARTARRPIRASVGKANFTLASPQPISAPPRACMIGISIMCAVAVAAKMVLSSCAPVR